MHARFAPVRDHFHDLLASGRETGAGLTIWYDGQPVVDLVGGSRGGHGPGGDAVAAGHAGERLLGRQAGGRALPAAARRPGNCRSRRARGPVLAGVPYPRHSASGVVAHRRAAGLPGAPTGQRDHRLGAAHRRPGRRRPRVVAGLGSRRTRLDVRAPGGRGGPPRRRTVGGPVPGRGDRRTGGSSTSASGWPRRTSCAARTCATATRSGRAGSSASRGHCGRGRWATRPAGWTWRC